MRVGDSHRYVPLVTCFTCVCVCVCVCGHLIPVSHSPKRISGADSRTRMAEALADKASGTVCVYTDGVSEVRVSKEVGAAEGIVPLSDLGGSSV